MKSVIEDIVKKVVELHDLNMSTGENELFCDENGVDFSAICNSSITMDGNASCSMNSSASFVKLIDHPVINDELDRVTLSEMSKATTTATQLVDFKGGYQIIDASILANLFNIMACPECLQIGYIDILKLKKQGLSMQMELKCCCCECSHKFWTSKKPKKVRIFDINKRLFYSMRRIGNGYAGKKRFLTLMNLPPPMTKSNYHKLSKKFHKAVGKVANDCMKEAAQEKCGTFK